jgi:hypothetical protein
MASVDKFLQHFCYPDIFLNLSCSFTVCSFRSDIDPKWKKAAAYKKEKESQEEDEEEDENVSVLITLIMEVLRCMPVSSFISFFTWPFSNLKLVKEMLH